MSQTDQRQDQERSFPSSIPVRSPSPDLKNRNRILKTISPTLQVRKQMTPGVRDSRGYNTLPTDQNEDFGIHQFDKSYETTDMKKLKERLYEQDRIIMHLTSKSGELKNSRIYEDLKLKIVEKDKTINDLKKVIATLSEKSQISESRSENERIRALEIQNERLGQIVKKLTRKDSQDKKQVQEKLMQQIEGLETKIEKLAMYNKQLEQKLAWNKKQRDLDSNEKETLRRQVSELLGLEDRNNSLEGENQRLLKLLTDKKQTLPEITISQQNQIFRLQGEIKALKEKSAPEKMTLSKIRQQYNESVKLFKEQVQHEIELQFQKMQEIINGLKVKLARIQGQMPRIQQLQREVLESPIKLAQLSKSYVEETADLTSEIKKQRQEKKQIQQRLDQLQRNYDNLIRNKEEQNRQSKEKMKQSVIDLQDIRNTADQDRRKHHEELQIIKNAHESDLQRLKNKHKEEIEQFKGSTKYQINEVVANYDKEIQVLKNNITSRENEINRLQQDLLNKEVEYKRNLQILEQTVRKESVEASRLSNQLKEKESIIRSLKQNKQEIQELGEVRKRSQTELQVRYSEIEIKYSELLSNHAETSTKYTQLLTKYNTTCEELQRLQSQYSSIEERNRILNSQNQMIPELKNRITTLEEQLLEIEHQLQEKKIQNEQLEFQMNTLKTENQIIIKEIDTMKSKLTSFGTKSKMTVESITRLENESSHSGRQFFRQLDEITARITRLEQENSQLRRTVDLQRSQVSDIRSALLKAEKEVKQSRFSAQQLKNDIYHLQQKLELKQRELEELRLLLENKTIQTSLIYQQTTQPVNLQDVENLKRQFERVMGSFSSEIVAIKRTVIESKEFETQQ